MAGGGTVLALLAGLPIALYLETYLDNQAWGRYVRLALDVLWGIPSIVYGTLDSLSCWHSDYALPCWVGSLY